MKREIKFEKDFFRPKPIKAHQVFGTIRTLKKYCKYVIKNGDMGIVISKKYTYYYFYHNGDFILSERIMNDE